MSQTDQSLKLAFGFSFEDLYTREGIVRLDAAFLRHLQASDVSLRGRLGEARANPAALDRKPASELVIQLAPHVEDFIGELFGIGHELAELQERHNDLAPMNALKRKFVQKKAISGVTAQQANDLNGMALEAELESLFGEPMTEASFTSHVTKWLEDEESHKPQLETAAKFGAWAALSEMGHEKYGHHSVLFRVPHKLDVHNLVPVETLVSSNGVSNQVLPEHHLRHREGFKLTDAGMNLAAGLDQANYCIKCHNQAKDSCSTGLREKDGAFKTSVFGVTLAGCPLDEKISEMNLVKQNGNPIGALAIVTIDNPMAAGTGHRICNDCMKSCIFQKQEPVDIPQVETRSLKDVLDLPWGFEIYSLLTRWNPLNFV
ncbi:MAG: pyridine nucleotide-disulfide oxidoreductase, partial [Acidobacteriota bacterium]